MKLIKLTSLISALLSCANPGLCNIHESRSLHECSASIFWDGYPHADPLNTYETGMVKYLAECAEDTYLYTRDECYLSTPIELQDGKKLRVEDCGDEGEFKLFDSDFLRWSLYHLLEEDGTNTGTTILAFMGTDLDLVAQIVQDASIVVAGPSIKAVALKAVQKYWELNPTYITGHSLGGTIAEMVCDQTGANGASFGAPGPYGTSLNLITEEKYDGAKFSVIMNVNDKVGTFPLLNGAYGYEKSHVACSDEVLFMDFLTDDGYGHDATSYTDEIWTKFRNW